MQISGSTPFNINRISDIPGGNKISGSSPAGNVKQTFNVPDKTGPQKISDNRSFKNDIPSEPAKALSTEEKKMFELLFPDPGLMDVKGPLKAYTVQNKQSEPAKQSNKRSLGNSIDLYV